MSIGRFRAVFGVDMENVSAVVGRAELMATGMALDPATYAEPNPPLPAFNELIANVTKAQTGARARSSRPRPSPRTPPRPPPQGAAQLTGPPAQPPAAVAP